MRAFVLLLALAPLCACDLIEPPPRQTADDMRLAVRPCVIAPASAESLELCTRVYNDLPPGPWRATALEKRADIHLVLGQNDAALADANAAIAEWPEYAWGWLMRARVKQAMGRHDDAIPDIEETVRLKPNESASRYYRALYLGRQGNDDAALVEINQAVQFAGDDRRELLEARAARCQIRADANAELEAALEDCDFALRSENPGDSMYFARGLVLFRLGRHEEAITEFDKLPAGDQAHAHWLYMRGRSKIALGRQVEGEADLTEARRLRPDIDDRARRRGYAPVTPPTNAGAK